MNKNIFLGYSWPSRLQLAWPEDRECERLLAKHLPPFWFVTQTRSRRHHLGTNLIRIGDRSVQPRISASRRRFIVSLRRYFWRNRFDVFCVVRPKWIGTSLRSFCSSQITGNKHRLQRRWHRSWDRFWSKRNSVPKLFFGNRPKFETDFDVRLCWEFNRPKRLCEDYLDGSDRPSRTRP